jgi:hypothetical protein
MPYLLKHERCFPIYGVPQGCQKSKRLSYMAKIKREVLWCTQEKGNHSAASIFGVDESNVPLRWKHKAAISACEASLKKFAGPMKGKFPEIYDAVFVFFQRRKTGINYIVFFFWHVQQFYHYSKIQLSAVNLICTSF